MVVLEKIYMDTEAQKKQLMLHSYTLYLRRADAHLNFSCRQI